MKKIMIIIALALSLNVSAQWTNKSVNNGFDDPYRICYTAENNGAILKLENIDGSIYFYLQGGYTCDEDPVVDLSFLVNGSYVKYSEPMVVSDSRKIIWIVDNLLESNILNDFKLCTSLKIRVNDISCSSEIFTFNMSGSTSALKYIADIYK
jgi:hypothetical protein